MDIADRASYAFFPGKSRGRSLCCRSSGGTDATVTMDKRQVPLLEILQELEKQTGIFFSYESSLLDEFPKISFKHRTNRFPIA